MLYALRSAFGALAFVVTTLAPGLADARQGQGTLVQTDAGPAVQRRIPEGARAGALPFVRTELFFGTARPGGDVTRRQFQEFVDDYVTPRFPDGLTVLRADGQFRGEDGVLVKEQAFVLIVLYPYDTLATSSQRIQQIRTRYTERFNQQSVLRVDDPFIVWVSF
jgi:hypothetical protein